MLRMPTTLAVLLLACAALLEGQWLNYPTPGMPRTSDGRPDLRAPTPRFADGTPDLSGVWLGASNGGLSPITEARGNRHRPNIAIDLPDGRAPLTPWGQRILDQRLEAGGRGIPTENCLPFGLPPSMLSTALGMQIVQTPTRVVMLFEEFNDWRQIFVDGRPLPTDPEPTWLGYSIGHWEGQTFVVQSNGFNDHTWLDTRGTPHSDQLRLTERYARHNRGRMDVQLTFNDPKAFTRAWSVTVSLALAPDAELLDHHCENERFVSRVGRSTP